MIINLTEKEKVFQILNIIKKITERKDIIINKYIENDECIRFFFVYNYSENRYNVYTAKNHEKKFQISYNIENVYKILFNVTLRNYNKIILATRAKPPVNIFQAFKVMKLIKNNELLNKIDEFIK